MIVASIISLLLAIVAFVKRAPSLLIGFLTGFFGLFLLLLLVGYIKDRSNRLQKQSIAEEQAKPDEPFFDIIPDIDVIQNRLIGLFNSCCQSLYDVRPGFRMGEPLNIVMIAKQVSDRDIALDVSYIRKGTKCGYDLLYNRLYNNGLRTIEKSEMYQERRKRPVRPIVCIVSLGEEVASAAAKHKDRLERELKTRNSTVEVIMLSELDLGNMDCGGLRSLFKLE